MKIKCKHFLKYILIIDCINSIYNKNIYKFINNLTYSSFKKWGFMYLFYSDFNPIKYYC